MQKDIVGLDIQELVWSHETTELVKLKLVEEGVTAYFFKMKDSRRYVGCLADDATMKVIHNVATDMVGLFNDIEHPLKTARHIFEREYQRLYFTRHASDDELLNAMIMDDRRLAPDNAKIFCCFVGLHNAATALLGKPAPARFFSFDTIVWHSRPRVTLLGKSRHISRTHTRKLLRGFKTACAVSVSYEFFRGKRRKPSALVGSVIQDNLTMHLSMSYPDGNWERAQEFVDHPNRKPLIHLFYSYSEE